MGFRRSSIKTSVVAAGLALSGWLVGCASDINVNTPKSTTGRAPVVAEVPESDETVRGAEEPAIVTLELGSRLHERRLAHTEPLPNNIIVPTTNLNAVPVTTALQAVLAGTDVSLSWDTGTFDAKLVTVTNLSGPLPQVVEKICNSAKIFCGYSHGLLELKEKETFIIELPAVASKATSSSGATAIANSMADAIGDLAGEKARVDQQGGNLIYTTTVTGQESVREYVEQLRNGRPLVVMQMYIWEVTLNKENAAGVNWNSFSIGKLAAAGQSLALSGSTAFTSVSSPGVSLGATLAGNVSAATVAAFLSTQGQVQTISNPQLTFVSGSNAEFRVGGKQRYVSQVGQLVSSNISGSNASNTGIGTNTVSTDSVDTGLTIDVNGAYESGIVMANMELTIQNLVGFTNVNSGGTQLQLPNTTDRKVQTVIRVRPGDNLVLAGLVSAQDTNNRQGIPLPFGARLDTYGDDSLQNTELVILVKPSVVLFSDKEAVADDKPARTKTPAIQQGMPDAVVIDKDGAKTFKMPDTAAPAMTTQPEASLITAPVAHPEADAPAPLAVATTTPMPMPKPELMVAAPDAAPTGDTPVAPGEDTAPVDRRLMQRGFSHAFDDLLTNSAATTSPSQLTPPHGGNP